MSKSEFLFNWANTDDRSQILDIWISGLSFNNPNLQITEDIIEKFDNNFVNRVMPYSFWVVKNSKGILVGWISILPAFYNPIKFKTEVEMSIYIRDGFNNNRLRTRLIQHVFDELSDYKIDTFWAFVGIQNLSSLKMCINAGMRECGRTMTKIILARESQMTGIESKSKSNSV